MAGFASYKSTIPGQFRARMTLPIAGLNEHGPASTIGENQLSAGLDVLPYRNAAIKFNGQLNTVADLYANSSDIQGRVVCAIADSSGTEEFIYLLVIDGATGYLVQVDLTNGPITKYDITSLGVPTASPYTEMYDACLYATEAKNYVVFCVSSLLKIIYFDGTTTAEAVTPFKPKRIVSHANRIFALDDKNKLWWSKAGDITTWYATTPTETSVFEDAGYWTMENERMISELCVIGNVLYLFGYNNIYAFRGTNYDTFSSSVIITGIGTTARYDLKCLTAVSDMAYFISPSYDQANKNETIFGCDIYEFDGNSYPKVISRPIQVGEKIINGISGGIYNEDKTHLVADENYLYLYAKSHSSSDDHDTVVYVFDIKQRTWWAVSGFNESHADISDTFDAFYIPSFNLSKLHCICSDKTATYYWHIFNEPGMVGNSDPYIVTKAFSSLASDKQTLTTILLQFQAATNLHLGIAVYYSLTASGDDFTLVRQEDDYIANGDVEILEIPMPVSYIANAHHYRLKVIISGGLCYLYDIERRFRTKGRSR